MDKKEFSMKNFIKFFGIIAFIAVIGFSMTACGGDDDDVIIVGNTSGKVTITNLPPTASGSRVFALHQDYGTSFGLIATASISSSGTATFGNISGTSLELKVWEMAGLDEDTPPEFSNFDGDGTFDFFCFVFDSISSARFSDENFDPFDDADLMGQGDVTFTNGVGTLSYLDIAWY